MVECFGPQRRNNYWHNLYKVHCEDSTPASPTWAISSSSHGLSRNMNDIHGLSSTDFRVRNPHQTGQWHLPSSQDRLPWLQSLRRGFPTAGRTNNLSTGLPPSQDHLPAQLFSGHAELLQTISAPRGIRPGAISRRPVRRQRQGFSRHHLDAGTSQDLRRVQGEFVTCTLAHPHPSEPLSLVTDASTAVLCALLQQRVQNVWQPLTSYPEMKPTASRPPPSSTAEPTQTRPPRHHLPSQELHASDATYVSLLASTAEQSSPITG
jgi:hypothetical protein